MITCMTCKIQYVGQTKNRLITRFQGHYHKIKHDNDTTVGRHFKRCPKETPLKFHSVQISVLQFIRNARLQITLKRRLKANALRVKKTKRWRGGNPRPMVLNASALPLHHADLVFHVYHIIAERSLYTTGRSGVGVRRWRSKP